jgi:hypothetical protein
MNKNKQTTATPIHEIILVNVIHNRAASPTTQEKPELVLTTQSTN